MQSLSTTTPLWGNHNGRPQKSFLCPRRSNRPLSHHGYFPFHGSAEDGPVALAIHFASLQNWSRQSCVHLIFDAVHLLAFGSVQTIQNSFSTDGVENLGRTRSALCRSTPACQKPRDVKKPSLTASPMSHPETKIIRS